MSAAAALSGVHFDAARHEYTVDGRPVPGVTSILEAVGISDFSMVPAPVLLKAQERGTAVHKAAWFDDEGDLDDSSVNESVMPYVEAWRAFKQDTKFVADLIEERVYEPVLRYAGTLDRTGNIPHLGDVLLDLKTGAESDSWPIQLAAYLKAHAGIRAASYRRAVVQLMPTGQYKTFWYEHKDYARHCNVFVGALQVVSYRKERGSL